MDNSQPKNILLLLATLKISFSNNVSTISVQCSEWISDFIPCSSLARRICGKFQFESCLWFHNNIYEWWELKVELSESSISNRFVISYSFLIKFDHFRKPFKVEKILEGSLDSIPPPSPSVKIQIMRGKSCLRCKGKTLLVIVNKHLKTKSLLTSPSNVLLYFYLPSLNFYWRWRWWDRIQTIFLNFFYFNPI